MDIIIRNVEEKDNQYKIYNKDGTGGHWYISKESAEVVSSSAEELERIMKPYGKECPNCDNIGWTAEHDPNDPHENGCSNCPIQVQCEFCYTEPKSKFNLLTDLENVIKRYED